MARRQKPKHSPFQLGPNDSHDGIWVKRTRGGYYWLPLAGVPFPNVKAEERAKARANGAPVDEPEIAPVDA